MIYYWDIETTSIEPFLPDARVTLIGIMSELDDVTFFADPDETKLLQSFWDWTREHTQNKLIGFNSLSFDYKYLVKRSIVCGVKPYLPFRFKNFDLRNAIDDNRYAKGSLQEICMLINGEHKYENLSGEDVIKLFHDGDYEKLKLYLKQDLILTKILYTRLKECEVIQ
jgi:uncharacterized protein YprB with RNaseH-like and TPR domain